MKTTNYKGSSFYAIQFVISDKSESEVYFRDFITSVTEDTLHQTYETVYITSALGGALIITILVISPLPYPEEFLTKAQSWSNNVNWLSVDLKVKGINNDF